MAAHAEGAGHGSGKHGHHKHDVHPEWGVMDPKSERRFTAPAQRIDKAIAAFLRAAASDGARRGRADPPRISQEEIEKHRVPIGYRDICAPFYILYRECADKEGLMAKRRCKHSHHKLEECFWHEYVATAARARHLAAAVAGARCARVARASALRRSGLTTVARAPRYRRRVLRQHAWVLEEKRIQRALAEQKRIAEAEGKQ